MKLKPKKPIPGRPLYKTESLPDLHFKAYGPLQPIPVSETIGQNYFGPFLTID